MEFGCSQDQDKLAKGFSVFCEGASLALGRIVGGDALRIRVHPRAEQPIEHKVRTAIVAHVQTVVHIMSAFRVGTQRQRCRWVEQTVEARRVVAAVHAHRIDNEGQRAHPNREDVHFEENYPDSHRNLMNTHTNASTNENTN